MGPLCLPTVCVLRLPLQLTDPFLQLFRGIIPPISGIDLSVSDGWEGQR